MTICSIASFLEQWAPKELAWEKDNVGLQVGNATDDVQRIIVALDVTENVILDAIHQKAELIISHHPLIFRPLKSVTEHDRVGKLVRMLVQHNIALYSAHTNLDFTNNGVSIALAEKLELTNIKFLVPAQSMHKKIVVFVPKKFENPVTQAMANAGAGIIGNYTHCSFRTDGTGTFRGNDNTNPFAGKKDKQEFVEEVRLEMIVPQWHLSQVIEAMKTVHPYEEIAYDIYPLENTLSESGMGAIGNLSSSMQWKNFFQHIKEKLNIPHLRFSEGKNDSVHRVAVCGGSGTELLGAAIAQQADAFVTADISYHHFHDAEGKICVVDAGHYETEFPILEKIYSSLHYMSTVRKENLTITIPQQPTSAIRWG
jgi:dinuclear metal center YbgI/SA1388 family protein